MRICRVIALFVVFEKFGSVLRVLELFFLFWKLNFQAVIKSAASAASPTAWELHGSARATGDGGTTGTAGRRIGSGDGFGALPCNSQAVGETALAADLITA